MTAAEQAESILVVEDERPIADILQYNLEKEGFEVACVYDGESALEVTTERSFDLVLLDIMLPKLNGFEVCKRLRQQSQVPVIMLTAKDDESDKIQGLEFGADDYITKPFSPRELLARVKALLRRVQASQEMAAAKELAYGPLVIDVQGHDARKQGEALELTNREFELIRYLASHPGQVFSREHLLEHVWGYEYYGDIRTVDVTIRRLREKVEDDPGQPEYLLTRRGAGYYFADPTT